LYLCTILLIYNFREIQVFFVKKLHSLVIRTYIGPFVMTFFISLFILLMQFLWKYVDDLVGKGLEWYIIAELLFYASATFVPLALPLAILLSSIMTMGSLGENYELVALKSAGISLTRIMKPLVFISLLFVLSAFYFSNNIFPVANLKMASLLYDVRQQRPALNIIEGIYYRGIDNYVIKVGEKEGDGSILRNIKIYDHSERRGNVNLTMAEWGTMEMSEDEQLLVFTLYNGHNYQDVKPRNPRDIARPFQRTYFGKQTRLFDLSAFSLARTDEDLFKKNFQMLNVNQLLHFEDSLKNELNIRQNNFLSTTLNNLYFFNFMDSTTKAGLHNHEAIELELLQNNDPMRRHTLITQAMSQVRQIKENSQFSHEEFRHRKRSLARYQIEFHRKFTLSFACLVLFMIGAPLGAIVRKGGFGLPVVISVLFFVLFHVVSMMGEKFVREGVLEAWQGMWMSSMFLLPVGIILIIKSTTDSSILDIDSYISRISKLKSKLVSSRKPSQENENTTISQ
jgi:lipopolysaccharide export system permease protein